MNLNVLLSAELKSMDQQWQCFHNQDTCEIPLPLTNLWNIFVIISEQRIGTIPIWTCAACQHYLVLVSMPANNCTYFKVILKDSCLELLFIMTYGQYSSWNIDRTGYERKLRHKFLLINIYYMSDGNENKKHHKHSEFSLECKETSGPNSSITKLEKKNEGLRWSQHFFASSVTLSSPYLIKEGNKTKREKKKRTLDGLYL